MSIAACVGDATGHPGVITGPGVSTVLIGGRPAAVVGDIHTCAMPLPPPAVGPHVPPLPMPKGSTSVLIGGRPALRVGDMSACGAPIVGPGCSTVVIGG